MAHCEQGRARDPRPHRVFHRSVNGPYTPLDATYAAARWGWYVAAFLVLGAGSYAPFLVRLRTGLDATHPELAVDLARRAAGIGSRAALALLLLAAFPPYLQTPPPLHPRPRGAAGALPRPPP